MLQENFSPLTKEKIVQYAYYVVWRTENVNEEPRTGTAPVWLPHPEVDSMDKIKALAAGVKTWAKGKIRGPIGPIVLSWTRLPADDRQDTEAVK